MPDPRQLISQYRQQGLSNPQIVQALQQQGFKSHEVFDAMNQVDMRAAGPMQQDMPQQRPDMQQQDIQRPTMQQPHPQMSLPPMSPPPMSSQLSVESDEIDDATTEKIEEIAESIIEEKWTDLINNVNKIVEWREKTERRLTKMESDFENMKNNFDKLHEGVLGKISEYEHGMTDLGTEIKALEKVFQKILPTLTENVNELSRITKKLSPTPSKK